jgi:membrane protein required for colicin V production
MVDNSRTAKVFASFQGSLNETIPEDAPGWIVSRYEELVASCGGPATPADPAPAPADAAPAAPAAPEN